MAERTMANDRRPDARALAVDLQHLRFAVAAADIGSFRQAADALGLRQSQLSRCIRQLEHSIGVVVFERSSGGVKPTPGGREFLRTARLILEQVDSLIASAKTTERSEAGKLAVGFCTSLSTGNLRAVLLDFKTYFPHIELATVERSRTRLTTARRAPPGEQHPSALERTHLGRLARGSSLDDARRRFVVRPSESNRFAEPI
jgi:DNA-binding transcriptional LysR family regulator